MTTKTLSTDAKLSELMQGLLLAAVGGMMIFLAGFANANALHGNAHDTRHAVVFPCH